MTTINFSLSVDQILRQIYAISALHAYNRQVDQEIPLLTDDLRDALRMLVVDNFGLILLRISEAVTTCDMPPAEIDTGSVDPPMTVTLKLPDRYSDGYTAPLLRALESAIAYATLRDAYLDQNDSLSNLYSNRAAQALENLRLLCFLPDGELPTIFPYY